MATMTTRRKMHVFFGIIFILIGVGIGIKMITGMSDTEINQADAFMVLATVLGGLYLLAPESRKE